MPRFAPAAFEPRISTLNNGLRIVSEEVPGLAGVTIGVWFGTGSVHERPGTGGQACEYGGMHFLEHVLFKGTRDYSGFEISATMDEIGAEFNAFTGKEHTCFHVQVPAEYWQRAWDILSSVVSHGRCAAADVDTERGVIADEIAGRDDDPEDLAAELGYELALPHHPLGRSILGDATQIARLDVDTLRNLHRRALDPSRMVVAAVGCIEHAALRQAVENSPLGELDSVAAAETYAEKAFASPRLQPATGELCVMRTPGQQVHLCLTALTPAREDELRPATHVAAAALGGGVSSRLFHHVRERHGMAYNIYAGVEQFGPAGVLQISASAPAARCRQIVTAIATEISDFASFPPSGKELDRAIAYLRGALLLGRDDPMTRMMRLGRHLIELGSVHSVAESVARLESVSPASVATAWSKITDAGWHTVLLGPQRPGALARVAQPLRPSVMGARRRRGAPVG